MWQLYREDLRKIRPAAWVFLCGSALMGGAFAVPWTLLQLYLDRLAFTKTEIGSVQSAEAWGQVLIALPAAVILARRKTPPLLFVSCLVTSVGYAALPWLQATWQMQLCKVVIGAAWWLHYIAIAPFLFRHSGAEERPTLFGLAEAVHTGAGVIGCFTCGKLVALLVDANVEETEALGWILSASGALPFAAALFYGRIREDEPPVAKSIRMLEVLARNRGLFVRFTLPGLVMGIGAGLSIPFLGLYFQDRFGKPPSTVGELYAAWQALATFGFLLSPLIVRRLGFVGGMVAVELLSIPFFLILAFTQNYPLAIFAFLLRGALMNTASPILKNMMMEASPPGTREVQVALNSTAWGVSWVIGPWLGGMLLDWTSNDYSVLMCGTVAFYFTASLLTWFLLRPLDQRRRVRSSA